jgi:hypothetical protein
MWQKVSYKIHTVGVTACVGCGVASHHCIASQASLDARNTAPRFIKAMLARQPLSSFL